MNQIASKKYALGDYTLDPAARRLSREDEPVRLAKLPFQVLLHLIENRDRVVTRAELLDRFWDGKDVYDDTLHKCIGAIRKALDDPSSGSRFVETRHREGYRYVGPFEDLSGAQAMVAELESAGYTASCARCVGTDEECS